MTEVRRSALVVDDSDAMQIFVKRMLELTGVPDVFVADGRTTALKHVADRAFDLFVIDLQMPDGTGHEVLAALRAAGHKTPAVAMTADLTPEVKRECTASGFVRCLSKPFTKAELVEVVSLAAN